MEVLAKEVVDRGVSLPGVQPKLSMSLVKETQLNSDTRLTVAGALGGNYIFKPPSADFTEMPENEHLTMRLAAEFGLIVFREDTEEPALTLEGKKRKLSGGILRGSGKDWA